MSKEAYMRHDISDKVWGLLEPLLPGRRGMWGGIATDNRPFINAVIWILRTGAPWRDLPPILWRLEKYTQALFSLERQGYMGVCIKSLGRRP